MKEISFTEIKGIQIGQAQNTYSATGCTVVLCKEGATAGVDVRGGGPATRETDALNPKNLVQEIHGLCLSGGSAFGLDATSGVMQYLEEQKCGFFIADCYIPIVCGASLFDLCVQDSHIRPDKQMGYEACVNSETNNFTNGNYGAGTGASVGKLLGAEYAMKTGQGIYAIEVDGIQVCALVALNAVGNVRYNGKYIAGIYKDNHICDPINILQAHIKTNSTPTRTNTTIGCIITNAKLTKSQCNKIASIAHNAYAEMIFPVHTMSDGDTVFVLSTNEIECMPDAIGAFSVKVMNEAIYRATTSAQDAYGLKSSTSIL